MVDGRVPEVQVPSRVLSPGQDPSSFVPVPGCPPGGASAPTDAARLRSLADAPASAGPVLLLAAHPDDEIIGAGVLLQRGADVTVAHVTDGAPRAPADARAAGFTRREDYAAARRRERAAALALCGIEPARQRDLGVADQEASLDLAALAHAVLALLRDVRPALLLTHAYEGGHPDHDATAFAAHAACALAGTAPRRPASPTLVEFTSYHAAGAHAPRGEGDAGGIALGRFLPGVDDTRAVGPMSADPMRRELVLQPTPDERAVRERMLDAHASQARTVAPFRESGVERLRLAPRYRFTAPPHAGRLYYEQFDWGMTGPRWRALAREALARLGLEEPL
ncbi:MAG TPA: PIG-L family deacetylase [Gemmatimonadales bacterium]|nr:PIG-L family deacetylase [Gemmatimonadales bacterium]